MNEADPMALIAAVNHNLTRSASPLVVAFVSIGGIRCADIHRMSLSGQGGAWFSQDSEHRLCKGRGEVCAAG